jgi:hypothetical protein
LLTSHSRRAPRADRRTLHGAVAFLYDDRLSDVDQKF